MVHIHRRLAGAIVGALLAGALVAAGTAGAGGPTYLLPWAAGLSFPVMQGPFVTDAIAGCTSGCVSHQDDDGHNSWDFDLPEGTPVLAARAGTVRLVIGSWSADHCGGLRPPPTAPPGFFFGANMGNQANFVLIDHGDGTSARYLHLSAIDPAIQAKAASNGPVRQGERLGLSGKTGLTGCVPHLHFQVERSVRADWYTESLPISFADQNVLAQNPDGVPAEGGIYESGNTAAG